MNLGMQQLRCGDTVIEYHLIRRQRKTLAIRVNTDLQVTVIRVPGISARKCTLRTLVTS